MKCPNCNGKLKFINEVSGSYAYDIDENHVVDDLYDFYGDSREYLECRDCETEFDFLIDDSEELNTTIVKIMEVEDE